jgi:hypothetical protein
VRGASRLTSETELEGVTHAGFPPLEISEHKIAAFTMLEFVTFVS